MYSTDKIAYRNRQPADASEHDLNGGIEARHAIRVFGRLSSLGFSAITVCSAMFGVWGVTCLASAMLTSNLQDLLAGLVTAITGF
jgi:hypothetical protein